MIRSAKLALGCGALQIEEAGRGDPLLLISGRNGLAPPWRGIVPALATTFRVITHDHLGLGGSDRSDGACAARAAADERSPRLPRRARPIAACLPEFFCAPDVAATLPA